MKTKSNQIKKIKHLLVYLIIFILNINQLIYSAQTSPLLNSSPLNQTSKKNKTHFFTLRSASLSCLAPHSGFKTEKSIKKNFISSLFTKYKTGLVLVTGLCLSTSLYCSNINPMEPGIIALNTLTGTIAYLFADFLSQKINEKNLNYMSKARILYMIPVALISRPLNYLWLNIFSNQLLNMILNGNTIPYLLETLLRTALDQTLFAFPFYIIIMTVKNFFSSYIEEMTNGTLRFNSFRNTFIKFKESMIQTFIPHYIDLKNFLFTPFTKLLIGDFLVSGLVMGVLFFFFPTTAFIPSSILNIFVTTFLTYLMHSKDLAESSNIVNQAENKIIAIKIAEKNAGNEMNREEFRKYFKQNLDKPITRLKLRSLLVQLCLNSSLIAKKIVSDEKYNSAIQTLNDFISNYQTSAYSA